MSAKSSEKKSPGWDRRICEYPPKVLVRRFFVTTLLVLLISYLGMLAIASTEGFAYLMGEKLGDHTGIAVKSEKSWCDARLNFFMDDVFSKIEDVEKNGQLTAHHVGIYWSFGGLKKLQMDGAELVLRYRPGAGWRPRQLGKIAELPLLWDLEGEQDVAEPKPNPPEIVSDSDHKNVDSDAATPPVVEEKSPYPELPTVEVIITSARIHLQDRKGNQLAEISEANLHYIPASMRDDGSVFFKLSARYTIPTKGRRNEEIRVEMTLTPEGIEIAEAIAEQEILFGLQDALQGRAPSKHPKPSPPMVLP